MDTIQYKLRTWQPKEVWHCLTCDSYRHRPTIEGILPAICCGEPAKLIDRYYQPKDEVIELAMAQMQSAALFNPEPTQDSGKGA